MAPLHPAWFMTGQRTRIQHSPVVTNVRVHILSPVKLIVSKSNGSDNKLNNGFPQQFTDNTFSKAPGVVPNVAEFFVWLCTSGLMDVAQSFLFNSPLLHGTKPPAAVSIVATSLLTMFIHRRKPTMPIAATKSPSSA